MPLKVTLEITNGPLVGHKFDFSDPVHCLIGRGKECTIRVPESYSGVSRQHCVLEMGSSRVTVKDLDSSNGTYRGGECIGRRDRTVARETVLEDGDELLLGGGANSGQPYLALRVRMGSSRVCAVCGSEVPVASSAPRPDRFVCETCRNDPAALLRHLEAGDQASAGPGTLAGYELLQKIGRGGFGSVFLARHKRSGRRVALKVMLPHIAHDPMMRRIFEREIENMKALRHPHIVELFEEGREADVSYFTMEYCSSGSVSSLVQQRGGTLPIGEALSLIYQAIDGLHYAHRATIPNVRLADGSFGSGTGLVHRDIKPCNLLLTSHRGEVVLKVGDYGLSKAWQQAGFSGVTRPGTKAGSFAYQPRQQMRGYRDAQPEVDVWALAATLYFTLTGTTPRDFPAGIAPELVVVQHPVVRIRERNPRVPRRLADVIDNVLRDEADLAVKDILDFKRQLKSAG